MIEKIGVIGGLDLGLHEKAEHTRKNIDRKLRRVKTDRTTKNELPIDDI